MRNGELRKVFPLFLLLFFLSLFLFLVDNFGWITGVRGIVQRPFLALERPIYLINQSISNSVKSVTSGTDSQRIIELQTQLRQLALNQNQLSTCLEENEHLKKLLGAPLPSAWKFKMARVVGISEKMRIDLGKKDEVEEGMVVVSENIYVGQVVSVGDRDSLVQLVNDPNSKIPVVIKAPASPTSQGGPASSRPHARGLLIGQFGGGLLLDKVLQNESLQQGDLVVTSGEESPPRLASARGELAEGETGYLPDLVIGQIKEVKKGTAEVYQQAIISPLVNYSSLRFVFLVIP